MNFAALFLLGCAGVGQASKCATLAGMDGLTTLEGTVERITYYSEEDGYSVIRLLPPRR